MATSTQDGAHTFLDDPDGLLARRIAERAPVLDPRSRAHLDAELTAIREAEAAPALLLADEATRLARDNGIRVGPGRGSQVGSLVSYLLGVTAVDPVEHGLQLERFYSPHKARGLGLAMDVQASRLAEFIGRFDRRFGPFAIAGERMVEHRFGDDDYVMHSWTLDLGSKHTAEFWLAGLDVLDRLEGPFRSVPMNEPFPTELTDAEWSKVFQCEDEAFRELLINAEPRVLGEFLALLCLFRFGPISAGLLDAYLDAMDQDRPTPGGTPWEAILAETYAIPVYQEQVARLCAEHAGLTLAEGEQMRRALASRKAERIDVARSTFESGALRAGVLTEAQIGPAFSFLEAYTPHMFNKSHGVAYALLTLADARRVAAKRGPRGV